MSRTTRKHYTRSERINLRLHGAEEEAERLALDDVREAPRTRRVSVDPWLLALGVATLAGCSAPVAAVTLPAGVMLAACMIPVGLGLIQAAFAAAE